ncbi:Mvd [Symbiodinium sp. KB8]|nr:Mvd [Symbiodinium sp. KB8]
MAAAVPAEALCVTRTAPTNIAVIKYWGKRDTALNLPINSSVSVTLNQDDLKAMTTVVASKEFTADRLWLNGWVLAVVLALAAEIEWEEDISGNKRVQAVLREIRFRAGDKKDAEGKTLVAAGDWDGYKVHIVSRNTFPTAAGLASSAAGYACLTQALADLFAVSETYPGELTTIARMGSGSACRSLHGGFVRWSMGEAADGKDSMAVQVAPESHWPELRVLVCVVSDKKKDTGSTPGMVASVKTSELLAHRATAVVPKRLADIEAAFLAKDFETFGRITMADSNQFHATCLDTFPPIFYMNDTSRHIIGLVHTLNKVAGRTVAAYTFDAAAEAVELPAGVAAPEGSACPGEIRHIYCTSMGDGPRTLPLEEALADPATGLPK